MAKQYDGFDVPFAAYDDLSSSQWLFVKMNGNGIVDACDGTTDVPVGVLQDEAATGQGVSVRTIGYTKVILGDTVTAGQFVGTDASAACIPLTPGTSTTLYVAGQAVVGGASGEIGEIILFHGGRAS